MINIFFILDLSHIRSPIISDKEKILEFCQNTFSWGDYIDEVYDFWINEGDLIILEQDGMPIGMCHGVTYKDEGMVWIEGIRVHDDYRRKGLAEKMVQYIEKNALNFDIKYASMLIESENIASLNLAKKMGYTVHTQWNYVRLESKKNTDITIFDSINFDELGHKTMFYVDSWRWIPIIRSNFERLSSKNNVLCVKKDGKIQSLSIISEAASFNDTILLTIVFGITDDIERMITYAQNFAAERNYTKIRIITEKDNLPPIDNLGKKFSFYLLKKNL